MQLYTAALKCMIRDTSEKTMYYLIISSKVIWEIPILNLLTQTSKSSTSNR